MAFAPLVTPVAGSYSILITRDGGTQVELGHTDDGFLITIQNDFEDVRADAYGSSVVNGVYMGGNCFLTFTLVEFPPITDPSTFTMEALFPYAAAQESIGELGHPGTPMTSFASHIQLTRRLSHTEPYRIIAEGAVLSKESRHELKLNSKLRPMPLTFQLFPYAKDLGAQQDLPIFFEVQASA